MFGLFKKDPMKELEKQYLKKMEQARDALRNGDVKGNGRLVAAAEEIMNEMERLKKEQQTPK